VRYVLSGYPLQRLAIRSCLGEARIRNRVQSEPVVAVGEGLEGDCQREGGAVERAWL